MMEENKIKCCESGDKCISEYNRGAADMLEAVNKIRNYTQNGGYSTSELGKIFGYSQSISSILNDLSATEILEKIAEYEEDKKKLHVGDIVKSFNCETLGVVTKLYNYDTGCIILWSDGGSGGYTSSNYQDRKTGGNINMQRDVLGVLKEMEG